MLHLLLLLRRRAGPWGRAWPRWLLALGWLLPGGLAAAQLPDTAAQRIGRLPVLLGRGWRYHAGDNRAWAQPSFDASAWDTLSPSRPQRELPPAAQAGVYWLRLRLRFSDSLRRRALLLHFKRLGTTELYLNGQLATAPADRLRVRGVGTAPEPLEVPGNGPAVLVLAVRVVPWQPPPWLLGTKQLPHLLLHLRTVPQERLLEAQNSYSGMLYLVTAGLFLLLAFLHYTFYYYNSTQLTNRYFARYTLALSLAAVGIYTTQAGAVVLPSWRWWLALTMLVYALLFLSGLWMVRALYTLFGVRPGRMYAGLVVSSGVLLLLQELTLISPAFLYACLVFAGCMLAELLRLTNKALHQRRRGAPLIGFGFAGGLLSVLNYLLIRISELPISSLASNLLLLPIVLSPALGISLFLAREFALDSELLQLKLQEVRQLSAQSLAQEQEKQLLLASQNETLEAQVQQRTSKLQHSLTDLRTTQTRLVQQEKMASLGELTAGIAHEIQNPLNFVNNFADVSVELLTELRKAQATGDATEAQTLTNDLAQNLGKIHQHGQRASGIVRGMLEHSRTSTGARQPTDLNTLADEYLRLAYHGLRAKDPTFNAALHTDFAPGLPLVEVMPGDLGRVLLNLLHNAFYAVRQRQQSSPAAYQPAVWLSTRRAGHTAEIRVRDNGLGMSEAVCAKVFQPFFTTKPTGEGTGLGLSLSHDIVTQGHGGTLSVTSQVGEGTEFVVALPLTS